MWEGFYLLRRFVVECLRLQKAKRFGDIYRISLRNGFKARKLAV